MNLFYVQADGKKFIRHIHDIRPTQWDEDNYCCVARLTPEQIKQFGVHQLKLITPPYFDPATQTCEHGPALLIDGVWTQNYIVSDLDADASAEKVGEQWTVIRAERNARLTASDWTQLADAPVDDLVWATYRQELRDMPANTTDPFNPVWPEMPA